MGATALRPVSGEESLQILNKIYVMVRFSLAKYLRYTSPWSAPAEEHLRQAIRHIADEQMESSNRLGALIVDRRGSIARATFPVRYTAFNDLSLAYLAPHVIEDQEWIVREIKALAGKLAADPAAYDLVLEIAGVEQASLDNLRDLLTMNEHDATHAAA